MLELNQNLQHLSQQHCPEGALSPRSAVQVHRQVSVDGELGFRSLRVMGSTFELDQSSPESPHNSPRLAPLSPRNLSPLGFGLEDAHEHEVLLQQKAYIALYRLAMQTRNFGILNLTAAQQMLGIYQQQKNATDLLPAASTSSTQDLTIMLQSCSFSSTCAVDTIATQIETLFAQNFCKNSKRLARKTLLFRQHR